MPPISEPGASLRPLKFAGLPDRDNPLAWKRKTAEGKAGARDLLTSLTDEEVARYMGVAKDQVQIEERRVVLKVLSAVFGLALAGFAVWHGAQAPIGKWDIAGLGLGLAMVYWPWRVFKCRQLWLKHYDSARAELARRGTLA